MSDTKPIDDGGPAFPLQCVAFIEDEHGSSIKVPRGPTEGMSLRDYFAGQALIGVLAARNGFLVDVGTENAPAWAYQVADNMLKERAKVPDTFDAEDDK